MPFSFLTLAVTNGQVVGNDVIKTGPRLVTEPPTASAEECAANDYAVCDDDDDDGGAESSSPTEIPPPPTPASRSLRQVADDLQQIVLGASGVAMAIVGGYVLSKTS